MVSMASNIKLRIHPSDLKCYILETIYLWGRENEGWEWKIDWGDS
jgi:hypothetical protein